MHHSTCSIQIFDKYCQFCLKIESLISNLMAGTCLKSEAPSTAYCSDKYFEV